jgi:hypothetical protein
MTLIPITKPFLSALLGRFFIGRLADSRRATRFLIKGFYPMVDMLDEIWWGIKASYLRCQREKVARKWLTVAQQSAFLWQSKLLFAVKYSTIFFRVEKRDGLSMKRQCVAIVIIFRDPSSPSSSSTSKDPWPGRRSPLDLQIRREQWIYSRCNLQSWVSYSSRRVLCRTALIRYGLKETMEHTAWIRYNEIGPSCRWKGRTP